jgi:Protein of unknown function, DUF488
MHYLYGSRPEMPRRLVATFDSEQQLTAYVRWATLSEHDGVASSRREARSPATKDTAMPANPSRTTMPRRLTTTRRQACCERFLHPLPRLDRVACSLLRIKPTLQGMCPLLARVEGGRPVRKNHTVNTPSVVLTIGHSTRTLETFLRLLQAHGVTRLVDVRTIPRSRHNPQFNQETLPDALHAADISYLHIAGLGGLRQTRHDSPNQAWRNSSFRGFADYMQTPEFEENLQVLIDMARQERVCLMCAEAVPWRCHRSLIADALMVRGFHVEHIMSESHSLNHSLRPWARVQGTGITYPAEPSAECGQAFEVRGN